MIGERIRARRAELNISLQDLARKVDLTASFLSQIERDLADPSIKSLRRISDALEVPMLYFLTEEENCNPVVRKNKRRQLKFPDSKVIYELLTPDLNRKMEIFMAQVHPSQDNIARPLGHHTEECILVFEGHLLIQLGEIEYRLEAG